LGGTPTIATAPNLTVQTFTVYPYLTYGYITSLATSGTIYTPPPPSVTNGYFTTPSAGGTYVQWASPDSTDVSGWTYTGGYHLYITTTTLSSNPFAPATTPPGTTQGTALQLSGSNYNTNPMIMSQNVTFSVGSYYLNCFSWPRVNQGANIFMTVALGSQTIISNYSYPSTGSAFITHKIAFSVTTAGTYALTFTASTTLSSNIDKSICVTGIYFSTT
jgi:hypothetical protein